MQRKWNFIIKVFLYHQQLVFKGSHSAKLSYNGGSYYCLAADPSIPFGTIIKITNHNLGIESTAYGIVVDRGGAIKKNHIDIFNGTEAGKYFKGGTSNNTQFEIVSVGSGKNFLEIDNKYISNEVYLFLWGDDMKIGVIQASSQIEKNTILYECTKDYGEVINFGCFEDEENYSYVEIALEICLLISSQAVDFIVTGCSSGQGMMIACNSLPNLICGYLPTPQDAYLFGRINDGNVASLPLGLNYGWAGEINLKVTLQQLFEEPFGIGYPLKDAKRKREDTKKIKSLNQLCKKDIIEFLNEIDSSFINKVLSKKNVIDYILEQGKDQRIKQWILNRR